MSIFPSGMFSIDPKSTPEQLAARKAMIAMLRPKYGSARYVGEGLGQLATGIVEGLQNRKMREIEGAGRDSANDLFSGLFGKTSQSTAGGRPGPMNILGVDPSMMAPPSEGAAVADDTMRALGKTPMRPYRDAIAGIESAGSGDYAAVGPTHPKMGRALGRYGIMESNIGPWSKEALGREVTPEEFMANPAIQDAIFDHKFGGYVEKYGPEGAAQAWLGGPGGVGKVTREDSLGTSIGEYGQKFMGALGGPVAAPAGASTATNSTTPPIDPQALAAALANPWISPEQRAMLTTIYDQQVQAGDPMRQIEIAKGVAELDAMNNPPAPEQPEQLSRLAIAKEMGLDDESARVYALTGELPQTADANVPAAFASLDMQAQAAGFAPGTPEYQEFMRNGGGSGTPAAFTALDMQAKAAGFEPGTPEYQDFMATRGAGLAAEAKTKGEAAAAAEIAAPADVATAERTLKYIDDIRSHPGREMGTGFSSVFNWLPGSSGKDFQNRVNQVTSGAFLTAIDEMRGMGSLSNAEGETARAAITRMDTATSEAEFLAALGDYEAVVMLGMDRAKKRIKAPEDAAPQKKTLKYNPVTGEFE